MINRILSLIAALLLWQMAGTAQGFDIRDGRFMLDGKTFRIYGGEMHYARIPREYWQHRIQMAKAMGCNTLSIYVFWNYQETAPGIWDWQTDNHDLRAFIELAKAEGMYIILRPGPYTCAEWDFGGLPYWLINNSAMKVRSNNQPFLDSCRTYLRQVYRQVDGLFIEQGGNIIMTQVENEFGSFAFETMMSRRNVMAYKEKLTAIYREIGFSHTLFTCDGGIVPVVNFARLGHIHGLFPGTNDSKFLSVAHHTVRHFYDKKGPFYIPEEYAGWFTHWGDAHVFHRDVEKYKAHIEELLKTDFSFCYYMVHGGTNFGFTSGTNHHRKNDVWPIITSYDYGAPIDEAGSRTPLYDSLRAVYQRYKGEKLPDAPTPIASMAVDKIELTRTIPLFDLLHDRAFYKAPQTFEQLEQAGGYLLYEKTFVDAKHGKLSTAGITGYALVYINNKLVATIDRNEPVSKVAKTIAIDIPLGGILRILVENTGRINFGRKLWTNARGATKGIMIDSKPIYDWMIYRVPMDELPTVKTGELSLYRENMPVFYSGTFDLRQAADTYLDMHGFGKGIVFINGHNLGRYWEVGPQFSLYVPGVWLREGKNEIVVFDQLNHTQMSSISATARPHNR